VREIYESYKQYSKPLEEVREIIAKEIPEGESLSRYVFELRKRYKPYHIIVKIVKTMNKTGWIGIALAIYGVIVLIGAAAACPAKDASISTSIFMILTGIAFSFLGKDVEKAKEAK